MAQLHFRGGARIGWTSISWPLISLTVSKDRLELNLGLLGNMVFKPSDVVSIEPYSGIFTGGIKINHTVRKYDDKVIFRTFKYPKDIINQIKQIGFLE